MRRKKLIYEGSVKQIYQDSENLKVLYFAYTDAYSVFDWGKMPDTLEGKGQSLLEIGAYFFRWLEDPLTWQNLHPMLKEQSAMGAFSSCSVLNSDLYKTLCKKGLRHHSLGINPDSRELAVQAVTIPKVEPFMFHGQTVLHYYPQSKTSFPRLIPMEVVFRFGLPKGSSLIKRFEKIDGYAEQLGFGHLPVEGEFFETPIVEYFTKLEPLDRFLPLQEALVTSGLSPERFQTLSELTLLVGLALYARFGQLGLKLWDGKLEWAEDEAGLFLVDSIGPDELRLSTSSRPTLPLSKELLRQYYLGSPWEQTFRKIKSANNSQRSAREICLEDFQQAPPELPSAFKEAVSSLYQTFANSLTGHTLFENAPLEFKTWIEIYSEAVQECLLR
jgi:phosphoribosylaminoimidazole-succinocarboxamide synthase